MAPQTHSQIRTSSPPIERGERDTPVRVCVLQLREDDYTTEQIRVKTGVPERTQRRFATTESRRPGHHRSRRPVKFSKDILD